MAHPQDSPIHNVLYFIMLWFVFRSVVLGLDED